MSPTRADHPPRAAGSEGGAAWPPHLAAPIRLEWSPRLQLALEYNPDAAGDLSTAAPLPPASTSARAEALLLTLGKGSCPSNDARGWCWLREPSGASAHPALADHLRLKLAINGAKRILHEAREPDERSARLQAPHVGIAAEQRDGGLSEGDGRAAAGIGKARVARYSLT